MSEIDDELYELLHQLCGAVWRLNRSGYISAAHTGSDEQESECEHWRQIAFAANERLHQILVTRSRTAGRET